MVKLLIIQTLLLYYFLLLLVIPFLPLAQKKAALKNITLFKKHFNMLYDTYMHLKCSEMLEISIFSWGLQHSYHPEGVKKTNTDYFESYKCNFST